MQTSIYKFSGIILFLINALYNYGQSKISGAVFNSQNQPLPDASVLLLNSKDSSLVKGTITSKDGQYNFAKITKGNYLIASSFVHYMQSYTAPINISEDRQEINEPALILSENTTQLGNIIVEKKKPLVEVLIDRLVVNVEGSITAAGGTALEVLERSPGVMVDPQNNSIAVNGKSGVVVMINSKISHIPLNAVFQMLDGMNAANIEKIEIITTPPANLDAEGNAGYINIVLKNNNQFGTNGSYSVTIGYNKKMEEATSASFNHRKGKFNLYGDYSFSKRGYIQPLEFYHKTIYQGKTSEINTSDYRDAARTVNDGRFGIDYQLDKKTIIGFLVSFDDNVWKMKSQNSSNLWVNQTLDTIISVINHETNDWLNYAANINLQHNYSADEKIIVNADYIYYRDNNPNTYLNSYFDGAGNFLFNQNIKSSKLTPISFWIGSVDYSKKISKKINLEAGVKASFSRFNNDVKVERQIENNWETDKSLSSTNELKENISAAYTSFTIMANDKTNIKLGLRFEHTNSNLGSPEVKNIVDRHYGNLFPSFFISYSINENNSINFSYSRRITRPTLNELAPFVIFFDPYTFFSGNPGLQPSITDAFKTDYRFKKIVLSLFYSYQNKPITTYTPKIDPATNIQTSFSQNQKSMQSAGISLSLPLAITPWWNMQNNITGTWQKLDGIFDSSSLIIQATSISVNSTQSFKLPKDFAIELSGVFQTPTFTPAFIGIYKFKSPVFLNLGIQKKLSQNSGSFRFVVEYVGQLSKFNLVVNNPQYDLVSNIIFHNHSSVRLTYSHNFGNQKLKAKRDRSTGAEDEKGRVNY